ncbi:phosphoribosylformylglycinamidine synthase I [bacterium]|nr:phosphoribosylformylglycinamidine synthase I [candidate division CSSED10-310 bacterium]
MNKTKSLVAVIQFPGTNCEFETAAALSKAGISCDIFRWNNHPDTLSEYLGFVIPGGFSYQDRVRAGAIAAKKRIMESILIESQKGKAVLGICNGAQILVETGLIPGIHLGFTEMSLASNRTDTHFGYHCDWAFVRCINNRGCFSTLFNSEEVIPIPVAHAEGRFTTSDQNIVDSIQEKELIAFQYCNSSGIIESGFPVNPNGSLLNIAGLYNKEGNVLALMPHPERASWMRQVPFDLPGKFGKEKCNSLRLLENQRNDGPGLKIFLSMKNYLDSWIHL